MSSRALKSLIVLSFSIFVYAAAATPLLQPFLRVPPIPGGPIVINVVVIVFCLSHAIHALGWRHALAFFGISAIVSWSLEHAGVATGTIYGGYFYTELLGPRLGHVPVLIPLSWFEYVYCSYVIANCLLGDRPVGTQLIRSGRAVLGRFLLLTLATAALTTAQDLVIDPIMSGEVFRAWVWETPGSYYGVPGRNFLGWLGTSFVVACLYRLLEVWKPLPPGARLSPIMTTLPVVVYGMNVIVSMSAFAPPGLKVIGPFVLGIPVLLTLGRIWLPTDRQDLFHAQ